MISQAQGVTGTTAYRPKGGDEQRFFDKHTIEVTDDANGNDDEVFKGTKVKYANRAKEKHGYDSPDDQKVHEEIEIEEDQLDELSKSTLASYAKQAMHSSRIKQKIAKDFEAGAQRSRKPDMKKAGEELRNKYQAKAMKREAGASKAIDRLAKEEVELEERELSTGEMKKREDYVKGMKKSLSGFKSRYGKDAKAVMYATATKMAKEDFDYPVDEEVDVRLLEFYLELDEDNRTLMAEMFDKGLGDELIKLIEQEGEVDNG